MPFTIPNSSAAAFPDQAEPDSQDLHILQAAPGLNGVVSGCAVTAQGSPNMTVAVAAGEVIIAGTKKTVTAGNVTITTANATNPRFDLICVDSTGTKSAVAGTAAANPEFPDPAGKVVLASVYVPANDTTIASDQITDKRVSVIPWMRVSGRLSTVADYGAVSDDYFIDGSATNASTTFTSATANFVAGDAGKTIVILCAGPSRFQDHHTTIASVTNSTTVVLTHAPNRTHSSCRFYISRSGDQTTAIQAAIDAAAAMGGGTVLLNGAGFLTTGLVLKERVSLRGLGQRATLLHLGLSSNVPVIRNDYTSNNSAMFCEVRDLWVDGARARQTDVTTTLGAAYTAGNTTITLTSAASFLPSGTILVGSNRLHYQSISGNTLNGVVGGREGTTDANALNGATVTQHNSCGIYFATNPYNATPTVSDSYDPHFLIRDVLVKDVKGYGIQTWGQSEARIERTWVHLPDHIGFMPSYDSMLSNCTADTCGRSGFFFGSSEIKATACKAFYCGGNVAAEGWGFFLEGPVSLEEGTKVLAACAAQDNKADGFFLRLTQRVILHGTASSNGTGGPAGTYCGARIDGATNCIIDLACTERRQDGSNNWQQNAISVGLVGAVKTTATTIRITHAAASAATVGAAIKSGSDLTGGVDVKVNGMGSTITPAYATPYTPDPYAATTHVLGALTGNLTINAPSNAHLGAVLVISLTASGATRTVTWNAAFVNTPGTSIAAGAYLTGRFVYNGTNWVGV